MFKEGDYIVSMEDGLSIYVGKVYRVLDADGLVVHLHDDDDCFRARHSKNYTSINSYKLLEILYNV